MSSITYNDRIWLQQNQPGLFVVETARAAIIQGILSFRGRDDGTEVEIEDSYKLRLLVGKDGVPVAHEAGGRLTAKLADDPKLSQADIHMYRGGRLCLAAPQQLTLNYLPNRSMERLFSTYIVPYFFSQSYHELVGEWPWQHLEHGATGLVQWFSDNHKIASAAHETVKELKKMEATNSKAEFLLEYGSRRDSFAVNNKCLCGSNKKYLQCHPHLWKLAHAIRYS